MKAEPDLSFAKHRPCGRCPPLVTVGFRHSLLAARRLRRATPPSRCKRAFLSGSRALMHPGSLACRFQPAAPERTSTEAGPGALAVLDAPSLGASFRLLLSIIACASLYTRVSVQPVQPCPADLPRLRCIPRRLAARSLLHVLERTPPRNVSPQASDFKSGAVDVPRNRPRDSIAQLGRSIAHAMYLAVRASCDPLSPAGDPPPAATGCY